jgi:hypothetical protein
MNKAYYFPMSGLYLQAFTDCLVQDWRGYVDLFACLLPGWAEKELSFTNMRTLGGALVSGWWNDGEFEVGIQPGTTRTIRVRVSRPGVRVMVHGHADGPGSFPGNEVVELRFNGTAPITLMSD